MKKTGEGLEQGEGGATRLSVKLSFPTANVTDCDDARCHIAVPELGEKACVHVNTQKKQPRCSWPMETTITACWRYATELSQQGRDIQRTGRREQDRQKGRCGTDGDRSGLTGEGLANETLSQPEMQGTHTRVVDSRLHIYR